MNLEGLLVFLETAGDRDFALTAASYAASAPLGEVGRALRANGYRRLTSMREDGSRSYRWIKRTAAAYPI
jgi:hypothetical protein